MAPDESVRGASDRHVVEFDHWIYGVVPGTGYTTKAVSHGLDAGLYDPYLRGHYTPIRAAAAATAEDEIDLHMIHPLRSGRELLLSRISRGTPDEAGRPTFTNHTVVARTEALRTGQVSLEAVFRSIAEFDAKALAQLPPQVPPLKIPVRADSDGPMRFGSGIHRHLTFPAIETLATRIMTDPAGRTLLLCRNTTPDARKTTLNLAYELLAWGCGLPLLTAISEAPRSSALNFFNLVVAQRGVRADSTWAILESALSESVLPRVLDRDEVYQVLTATVRQSVDLPFAR